MLEIYGDLKESFSGSESVNMKKFMASRIAFECDGFIAFVIDYEVAYLCPKSSR